MRKDYIIDRWVVFASSRKRRPTDFTQDKKESQPSVCPFCPGNEHLTPPAILLYLQKDGIIVKDRDSDNGTRRRDWLIRCIPNLYPAFQLSQNMKIVNTSNQNFESKEALGHHELIIESPKHDEHPGVARLSQLINVIHAYQDRSKALYSYNYVTYISIFRNHGQDAGASLSHPHSQIIATQITPYIPKEELRKCEEFWNKEGRCVFCNIIKEEQRSQRLIWQNNNFVAFAPWASINPYELWIFPKRHQQTILEMSEGEVADFASILRVCLGSLNTLFKNPSYNFGFHMIRSESYHWHVEVYPKLTIWAGFEKSTGMFINVVLPEDAAANLKEVAQKEENQIVH